MQEWWISLGAAGQVFACIAIPATLMLLIQTILTIIGIGSDSDADVNSEGAIEADVGADADADFDTDSGDTDFDSDTDIADGGLRVFTLRGLVAFFSVMGWVGALCSGSGLELSLSVVISVASGALAMLAVAFIMKWLFRLQDDGTEDICSALGVSGTVYLRIPPSRTGKGKISAIIRGQLSEKFAVTDEETELKFGEEVTVVGISGESTLIVRRKNKI